MKKVSSRSIFFKKIFPLCSLFSLFCFPLAPSFSVQVPSKPYASLAQRLIRQLITTIPETVPKAFRSIVYVSLDYRSNGQLAAMSSILGSYLQR
jgi:hypothetical protein